MTRSRASAKAAGAVFTLTVPMALVNNSNHRTHWALKARRRAHMRELALYTCVDCPAIPGPVHLTVTFAFPDRRNRDLDNYEIKGAIDGAVDAGVITDDRSTVLRAVTRRPADVLSPRGFAVLTFAFRPVGDDA